MGTLVKRLAIIGITFMFPGNCHLYNHKGRFIKGISGRNYSGNGNASRGISSSLNHFPCSGRMANVKKISIDP